MSWSKVQGFPKKIGWWEHKILAEVGYALRNTVPWGMRLYNYGIRVMVDKYRINIYGQKVSDIE